MIVALWMTRHVAGVAFKCNSSNLFHIVLVLISLYECYYCHLCIPTALPPKHFCVNCVWKCICCITSNVLWTQSLNILLIKLLVMASILINFDYIWLYSAMHMILQTHWHAVVALMARIHDTKTGWSQKWLPNLQIIGWRRR